MREGHRFRFFLAMNCQVAAVAEEGAEAPCSKAPAVLEYDVVLPTNFLGLHPARSACPCSCNRWNAV
jgi:hypothetical protein